MKQKLCLSMLVTALCLMLVQPRVRAAGDFEIQKLADGVYAALRNHPPLMSFDTNNVFIINDDDVIVVDANASLAVTKELVAALRKLTSKPVKYVINTHWHDDHIIGNQVWREAFPNVEFVAHASTLRDRPAIGDANRQQMLSGGRGYAEYLRKQVAQNKSLAGAELTEEERVNYLADAKQMARLLLSLKEQTASAVARGETLEQARQSVNLKEFRQLFAGDSTMRRILFGDYVSGAGVAAAFREATERQPSTDDAKAALAVVNQLFAAMRAKDATAMQSLFLAEGQFVATDRRNGQPARRVFNGESFAKLIIGTKGLLQERMYKPEVRVNGDLALVWGRYGFYVDERFSHCGLNAFQLLRTTEGCEPESKEKG